MVCAPVRSIIPSLKLGDYLSVQAHKPCSISHFYRVIAIVNCPVASVLMEYWPETNLNSLDFGLFKCSWCCAV